MPKLSNIFSFIRKSQLSAYGDFRGVFRYNCDYVFPSEIAASQTDNVITRSLSLPCNASTLVLSCTDKTKKPLTISQGFKNICSCYQSISSLVYEAIISICGPLCYCVPFFNWMLNGSAISPVSIPANIKNLSEIRKVFLTLLSIKQKLIINQYSPFSNASCASWNVNSLLD